MWEQDKHVRTSEEWLELSRIKIYAHFTFFLPYGMSHYFGATGEQHCSTLRELQSVPEILNNIYTCLRRATRRNRIRLSRQNRRHCLHRNARTSANDE